MNTNANKWVAALRSGEYKQTKKHLTDDMGHCCLGVACELYIKDGGALIKTPDGRPGGIVAYGTPGHTTNTARLPDSVMKWLGLKSDTGIAEDPGLPNIQLSSLNDHGSSFREIADVIEKNKGRLFVKEESK